MPITKKFDIPQLTLKHILKYSNVSPVKSTSGQRLKSPASRVSECTLISHQYSTGSRDGFRRTRHKYPTMYNEFRGLVRCSGSGKKRYTYIRFYGPPSLDTPVWVWCSCEHFAYTYEWVLAKYKSSTISAGYNSVGVSIRPEPPQIRNPNKYPGACKHILLSAKYALTKKDLIEQREAYVADLKRARRNKILQRARPIKLIR